MSQTNTHNASDAPGGRATTGSSVGETTNESFSTTPLLYPSDIRELPRSEQILIIEGKTTIQWRVQWFRDHPYTPHKEYLARRAEALASPAPPSPPPLLVSASPTIEVVADGE